MLRTFRNAATVAIAKVVIALVASALGVEVFAMSSADVWPGAGVFPSWTH